MGCLLQVAGVVLLGFAYVLFGVAPVLIGLIVGAAGVAVFVAGLGAYEREWRADRYRREQEAKKDEDGDTRYESGGGMEG